MRRRVSFLRGPFNFHCRPHLAATSIRCVWAKHVSSESIADGEGRILPVHSISQETKGKDDSFIPPPLPPLPSPSQGSGKALSPMGPEFTKADAPITPDPFRKRELYGIEQLMPQLGITAEPDYNPEEIPLTMYEQLFEFMTWREWNPVPAGTPGTECIYRCVVRSRDPAFHIHCGVGETDWSYVHLLWLHGWMIYCKFKSIGLHKDHIKTHFFFEHMWEEVRILKARHTNPILVRKVVREIQTHIFGTMMAYDEAFWAVERGDHGPLLGALFRNIYLGNEDINKEHLFRLKDYMIRERAALMSLNPETFVSRKTDWSWGPLPSDTTYDVDDYDLSQHAKPSVTNRTMPVPRTLFY